MGAKFGAAPVKTLKNMSESFDFSASVRLGFTRASAQK